MAQTFIGLGFDVDHTGLYTQISGDIRHHGGRMRAYFGCLCMHGGIHIDYSPTSLAHLFHSRSKQRAAICAFVCRVGIREMTAYITQTGGAQYGVSHGMQQDIGIGMPQQAMGMRNQHAAYNQRPPGYQSMNIKTLSYTKRAAHFFSSSHLAISPKSSGQVTLKLRTDPGTKPG